MKNKLITASVVGLIVIAIAGVNSLEPSRASDRQIEEIDEAQEMLDAAEEFREKIAQSPNNSTVDEPGKIPTPDEPLKTVTEPFKVKFETSAGDFVIECTPEWAPRGAARFKEIVEKGIYNDARFFRVLDNFMVQFGIPGDPKVTAKWKDATIKADPVKKSNTPGMVSYAMLSGNNNSRTTQIFINTADNARLDGMDFAPFAKVIEGMENVMKINSQHRQDPNQMLIERQGNAYLMDKFPALDYVIKATIIE